MKDLPRPLTWEDSLLYGKWQKREPVFTNFPFAGPQPGPSVPVDRSHTAEDLFCRFFTHDVWTLIIEETNRQARALNMHGWKDITLPELKAFVGILLVTGILKLPRLYLYWTTTHPLLQTKVRDIMSSGRFFAILRALHLNDSTQRVPKGQPDHDPLFEVRKLLDLVTPRFEDQFNLHEEVSIDEAMIPFKGRLSFKQYLPNKPTKWGIKVFVLADACTGYTKRIQIYTGKNTNLEAAVKTGLTTRLCLDLVKGLESDHIKLFVDNFYTSPSLFIRLYRKGVNACGTARSNCAHFPKQLIVSKDQKKVKVGPKTPNAHRQTALRRVGRGYISHRASGPLLATVWVDKRVIYFLTTMHRAKPHATVRRRGPEGRREDKECPPCLPDYQKYMRGVDRGDQLQSYYYSGRRSVKWWKRVFTYIIEASALNAYILDGYRLPPPQPSAATSDSPSAEDSPPTLQHRRDSLQFRIALAHELIGDYSGKKHVGRRIVTDSLRRNRSLTHLPLSVAEVKQCALCNRRRQRHETHIKCTACQVHLCIQQQRNCFHDYHTLSTLPGGE